MRFTLAIFILLAAAQSADARSQWAQGRAILQTHCAKCHAIGKTGDSPFAKAPPFRQVMKVYHAEDLAEGLSEGLVTGHPAMPVIAFEPDQIGAIMTYLKSISPRR